MKRYDLEQPETHMGSAFMREDGQGDWVRFSDAQAAVNAAVERAAGHVISEAKRLIKAQDDEAMKFMLELADEIRIAAKADGAE